MDPEGITSICNLITPSVEARPIESKVDRRTALVVYFSPFGHELVLVDEAVCVVAGFSRVCFIAVRV